VVLSLSCAGHVHHGANDGKYRPVTIEVMMASSLCNRDASENHDLGGLLLTQSVKQYFDLGYLVELV
jgi:hypothetical protein